MARARRRPVAAVNYRRPPPDHLRCRAVDQVLNSLDEVLQLALDLCVGTGAFLITADAEFHGVVSEAMPPENGLRRIEALARSCLLHPGAGGREIFWNAEVMTEAVSADSSLACVVVPVWAADAQVGLLGVVDTWLPEPDDDQRAGMGALAEELGRLVAAPREAPVAPSGGARPRRAPASGPVPRAWPPPRSWARSWPGSWTSCPTGWS